jgi:hypothetical protein
MFSSPYEAVLYFYVKMHRASYVGFLDEIQLIVFLTIDFEDKAQ